MGLVDLPWWGYIVVTLVVTHITIAAVTIYLHRHSAHRALDLHPAVSHFFRLWLWLTTGMVTKEWVAIHRKHHAKCETPDDPHSPQTRGIKTVLLTGSELYRNLGNGKFQRVGRDLGVHNVGWAYGPALFDMDGDGFLDIYGTAGFVSVNRQEPDG